METIQKIKSTFRSLQRKLYYSLNFSPAEKKDIVSQFHKLYYDAFTFDKTWYNTHWLGARVQKCPLDLWVYQEIIYELKPDLIIETGTLLGGSTYYLAHLCDLIGKGKVVTIDIDPAEVTLSRETRPPEKVRPQHPRITYILGSSTDPAILERVKKEALQARTVLVILDSDHRRDHVRKELELYGSLVTKGSYMIVEDSNINGHPVMSDFGPGPMEAIEDFIRGDSDFVVDRGREHHMVTFNPSGFLKKIR